MALRQTRKISELEALTSASLQTTLLGVDNGTTYKVTLDVLEDAIINMVSRSTDLRLDSLEAYTASVSASSIPLGTISSSTQISNFGFISSSHTDITSLNSFTSSQNTLNSAFTSGINARLQTSSFNDFSTSVDSRIIAATNEQSFNGLISGSSQLTSSYDERYVLSGSITQTNWDNIANKPSGIVSQSTDLSSLNTFTASISTASLVTSIDNLNTFTASQSTSSLVSRLNAIENVSASWITESETGSFLTSLNGTISSSAQITAFGFISSSQTIDTASLVTTSSFNSYTASISTASLVTSISNLNSATSSYLASLSGAISSSSQLTSSYDTRYTLSGSVVSGTTPAGTISGSSQLTSSFDGRYTQTGSFNTLTQSFNSFTASAQSVTTGSNSFNGTQIITGSLIITTGSFVASQILANTSSLYLTSGSNMYVQNNGLVEITGSLRVSGSAAFNVNVLSVDGRSGDEGGEINLAIPVTNTTLQNRVSVDIFQNRLRIFEGSADAKGVYIDLSKAPAGNSAELLTKASGLVGRGTDVTLGNLKVRFASTGNMSLQVSTITGTYSVYGSGIYTQLGSTIGTTIDGSSPLSVTTTPAYLKSSYNFGTAGATDTWVIMDTSNTIAWRITMIIGAGFSNNLITIERLL
jgi:hypothetical protein